MSNKDDATAGGDDSIRRGPSRDLRYHGHFKERVIPYKKLHKKIHNKLLL
jgi:hypothetical protein